MGETKGKEGQKVMHGLLAHPFRAKMVSCPPLKGGLRDHFLGVPAHNVNFWAILGSFCTVGPKCQKTQNLTPWCCVECILSDLGEVEFDRF